jgi:hypothetical protein
MPMIQEARSGGQPRSWRCGTMKQVIATLIIALRMNWREAEPDASRQVHLMSRGQVVCRGSLWRRMATTRTAGQGSVADFRGSILTGSADLASGHGPSRFPSRRLTQRSLVSSGVSIATAHRQGLVSAKVHQAS